ncbi:MAG: glutamate--tRNA ligase [Liquorilactobacillus nagelii]|uniref:Glutamate--tRNA ligase n=1 Tax=Liquorilactobacillus nagelii TaxID=82688 RepID=A0A3Q8CU83_9LACO|nr:glutamate--tRNA ligase [Liquorilactobacillus nagelii]AUJ31463.1 glutamate--tRNA ligase [Liquorilactobacillus nagelii]KRL41994.1 glutamyl-tRNA synthetase [Liquorilactobacillus nagelii DSM 13675]MCC7617170.1 glutamate--tRNA ligase [Liquorilactobacillus nagelii]MCI1699737.1 glutamate--tRNA ligase [Liquorilactobacillus nagelii]MCP9316101.1 glutamate--tRNA ligase [Liquorilactobacillus nagelii]
MADKKIRVRYAPSPTGHLHIGNARTALFNYLFARHNGGTFVIRIEDTDLKRNIADGERSQLDNLKWLGMDWDEGPDKPGDFGPYRQSERLSIYKPLIQKLLDNGQAYESFVTEEELTKQREEQRAQGVAPHYVYEYQGMTAEEIKEKQAADRAAGLKPVVRIRVPENKTYEFDDIVKGPISFDSDTIGGDFVIQKRDGMPTYNFAVVVDDHMMQITHVLRGDDHIANTPKQLVVYEAFGWEPPVFGHMTLIINTETGKKLSKRDESVLQFIEQYRELGYLPDAMFNFITLLGWSPVGEKEIFTRKQLIKMFDPKRLSRSPASFDGKKLEWVNNQYVKNARMDRIANESIKQLIRAKRLPENPDAKTVAWARSLTDLFKQQMSYMGEIIDLSGIFFLDPPVLDEAAKTELRDENAVLVLEKFIEKVKSMPLFDAGEIQNAIFDIQAETGVRGRKLYMPIRIGTTRKSHGPELAASVELLGRKKALAHLEQTLTEMKNLK